MDALSIKPSEIEYSLRSEAHLVTRSDMRGIITYANRDMLDAAGVAHVQELLCKPHRILRHPWMPRGIFYLMWQRLKNGKEFFGFFKNIRFNGDHYWIFAHIIPEEQNGTMTGYIASRRPAPFTAVRKIEPIYEEMRAIEQSHLDSAEQCIASARFYQETARRHGLADPIHFARTLYEA